MKLDDLPTNEEWNSWGQVLASDPADPADDGWTYGNSYSGAYSTVDGSKVEDITAARIATVDLWFGESPEGYGSLDFVALCSLTDGRWAACLAWADTTGWGCRDGVQWKVAPARDEAISQGLDRAARVKLGVLLPGEEVES